MNRYLNWLTDLMDKLLCHGETPERPAPPKQEGAALDASEPRPAPVEVAAGVRAPQSQAERAASIAEPVLVVVPAGLFTMGEGNEQQTLDLPAFQIGKYPVTNRQYAAFVQDGQPAPSHWEGGSYPEELANHPVVNVFWSDAIAYCRWLAAKTGRPYRLPTEAEWEKAASWDAGKKKARIYPWGDTFERGKCNSGEGGKGATTPVGAYSPAGDSPYGCADMAGNVWEWCATAWRDRYAPEADKDDSADLRHVVRGGSFSHKAGYVHCAYRDKGGLYGRGDYLVGFRVAVALSPAPLAILSVANLSSGPEGG